jgi:5-methylcytosine-specific restriction endonuclease McrA
MQRLSSMSNDALLHRLDVIVGSHRRVTADLLLHLGEVDARRLHVEKGFSSLFGYCLTQLCFSEDEACRRIETARLARRFPAIYPLLSAGSVSLTVLGLLKPHLTDDNHEELLAGVSGSSVRSAKEWLAARFPAPDVPSSIRKLPERRTGPAMLMPLPAEALPAMASGPGQNTSAPTLRTESPASARARREPPQTYVQMQADPLSAHTESPLAHTESPLAHEPAESQPAPPHARTPARARVEPLSGDRFLVKFTASRAMREKLEVASDLMRHANPNGEITLVLERALDLLIVELEKTKQGRTTRPRGARHAKKDTRVTRAVRREVVARDGWRCSFVANDGHACDARGFLEFDHRLPKARGGTCRPENLRLLCRAHNRLAAERAYGEKHVSRAIFDSRLKMVGNP